MSYKDQFDKAFINKSNYTDAQSGALWGIALAIMALVETIKEKD